MATHVYWRILITDASGSYSKTAEIRMYDSSGTSLCSGGTITASSNYPGYPPSNAFDGNTTTFWHTNNIPTSGSPEWIEYQFASAVDVAVFELMRYTNDTGPTGLKLQYSDNNSTWTDATAALTTTYGTGEQWKIWAVATPPAGSYLAWRFTITAVQGGGSTTPSVAEIAMRATPGGSTINPTNTIHEAKDFFSSSYIPDYAFDANSATFWNANSGASNWIKALFPIPETVVEVAWTSRPDSLGPNQSPTSVTVEGSNNGGTTWTTVTTLTPATWTGTTGQTQTFTFGGSTVCIAAMARPARLIGSGIYV